MPYTADIRLTVRSVILPFFCWSFLIHVAAAQQVSFEKFYDYGFGEVGTSVEPTYDGGYIITGVQGISFNVSNLILIKTDSAGQTEWDKFIGTGANENFGYSIKQNSDSGFIIAGYTTLPGLAANVYIVKTDKNGDTLWTKNYGGPEINRGYEVVETLDSGYAIAAQNDNTAWLLKVNSNGDTLWTKRYNPIGSAGSDAYSLWQTTDSGFVLTGVSSFGATGLDVLIIRTDKNGDTLWTRTYGGAFQERGQSVQQTSDGGFIVAGYTWSFGAGNYDVWLIKMDTNGDTLWTKTFGNADQNTGWSLTQTMDGGFIIAGNTYVSATVGNYDAYLIKTNSNGIEQWSRTFGGADTSKEDMAHCVRQTQDGGYVIVGQSQSFSPTTAVYLIKTDSMGNVAAGIAMLPLVGEAKLLVYPNPFSEQVTIIVPEALSGSNVVLVMYDLAGREVKKLQVAGSKFQVERDGLPAGIYFVRLGEQVVKLVKQ